MADDGRQRPRPRRSPPASERVRDAERTRAALLDAALAEFSAHGRVGARVSAIAQRAGVDKQLIAYYFGGKDGLYRALVQRWLRTEQDITDRDLPLEDLVARYVAWGARDRALARLLVRVALDDDALPDEEQSAAQAAGLEDLRARQAQKWELADDLDPACVLLVLQSAAAAGVVFPRDVRELTGMDPASERFAEHYAEQLRRIVRRLREPA